MAHPNAPFKLMENELLKMASYENVRSILSSYGVSTINIDDEVLERILVILITEVRHTIEKFRERIPEGESEADGFIEKSASRVRKVKEVDGEIPARKTKAKPQTSKVIEVLDTGDELVEIS